MNSWERDLTTLIDAGAELINATTDGTVIEIVPLARAWRRDDDVIWIRPLTASYLDLDEGAVAFSLNGCRRRALPVDRLHRAGDAVSFHFADQVITIRATTGERRAELERWDRFVLEELEPAERDALDELAEDSWTGRYP